VEAIYQRLKKLNIEDKKERDKHIERIKNIKQLSSSNSSSAKSTVKSNNMCPRCYIELIEKNGKYGKFLGCPNFPKCFYTKNVK